MEFESKNSLLPLAIHNDLCMSYLSFILACRKKETDFSLTPDTDVSPFALCFALFGAHFIGKLDNVFKDKKEVISILKKNLAQYKEIRSKCSNLKTDKAYMQLLAFTLSSIYLLGGLEENPLETFVVPLIASDINKYLNGVGALDGVPQSGNMAMFAAILLIHARDYLGQNTQSIIDDWVELHIKNMNQFGFWGAFKQMTFLQFQNGYHQYEIFDYLSVTNRLQEAAAISVAKLMDYDGHYAPYPGGGGCYDYDAVAIITSNGLNVNNELQKKLELTFNTIKREKNPDGGFCESHYVHPIRLKNIRKAIRKIYRLKGLSRIESIRLCAAIYSPKHNRVHTHWSKYSRKWNESDLWDSYFRIMTIARIDIALNKNTFNNWAFINYPGIGFHPSSRIPKNEE